MERIRISVRSLVEFLLRSGDIDSRKSRLADKEAMQLGSRIHRKIQGRMGSGYRPEVSLKKEIEKEKFILVIEGRADGIFEEEEGVTIDEIKGVYRNLSSMEEPELLHLAQAKCYAAIYGKEQGLSTIFVQMTYCNLETEEIRRFTNEFSVEELDKWFMELAEAYCKWCEMQTEWKACRQKSIHSCEFPFAYREGQKQLAAAVYRTMEQKRKLFIQAPTGVGKTISTIFPAVRAVGEGFGEKIFYLTAKTVTRTVAEETFSILKERGLRYKVLTLTAKEKICPMEEAECDPQKCPYAKGHYDRVNDAVFEMLIKEEVFDRKAILRQSEKWKVCPFEMTLDMALWVDAVICDYNYVFDPRAKLKRFFGESVKGEYLFLIDEAHNLAERGREMYSAVLQKERFLEMRRLLKEKNRRISRTLEKCNKIFLEWKRECETYLILDSVGELIFPLMNLMGEIEEFLEEEGDAQLRKKVLEFYFEISNFLNVYDLLDEHYVTYATHTADGGFMVRLYCVDTSTNLQKCLDRANAAVFFSATLLPIRYHMSLLSEAKDDYAVYAKSPFDPANRAVLIASDVSSRYTKRGTAEYQRIADYIKEMVHQKKGNYLVFFPSYRMLQDVAAYTEPQLDIGIRCIYQTPSMTEKEREDFLAQFEEKANQEEGLVGFCVMGGVFGEGIDLKEDSLIGAAIVGTGIPQICLEREILKKYYDARGEDGFAYAYRYPGMNKVLQAAGRVIRTATDRGVILLLDERFAKMEYRRMFPREWEGYQFCSSRNAAEKLQDFWKL